MELICKHNPKDPDHLICEMKRSPMAEWFARRFARHYCVGPTCPPHKAYGHLWVDALLAVAVVVLVVINIMLTVRDRRPMEGPKPTFEEELDAITRVPLPAPLSAQPSLPVAPPQLSLEMHAGYFSPEGEQVGRGPWPPRAGERTTIAVVLKPTVEGEFKDVEVLGTLAPSVEWTGFAPISRGLSFERRERQVHFKADGNLSAVFEVAITPTPSELENRTLIIMTDITLFGRAPDGARREIALPHLFLSLE